jgi:hypothetical protein
MFTSQLISMSVAEFGIVANNGDVHDISVSLKSLWTWLVPEKRLRALATRGPPPTLRDDAWQKLNCTAYQCAPKEREQDISVRLSGSFAFVLAVVLATAFARSFLLPFFPLCPAAAPLGVRSLAVPAIDVGC